VPDQNPQLSPAEAELIAELIDDGLMDKIFERIRMRLFREFEKCEIKDLLGLKARVDGVQLARGELTSIANEAIGKRQSGS
jgi:thiamine pyrophosphokinase